MKGKVIFNKDESNRTEVYGTYIVFLGRKRAHLKPWNALARSSHGKWIGFIFLQLCRDQWPGLTRWKFFVVKEELTTIGKRIYRGIYFTATRKLNTQSWSNAANWQSAVLFHLCLKASSPEMKPTTSVSGLPFGTSWNLSSLIDSLNIFIKL